MMPVEANCFKKGVNFGVSSTSSMAMKIRKKKLVPGNLLPTKSHKYCDKLRHYLIGVSEFFRNISEIQRFAAVRNNVCSQNLIEVCKITKLLAPPPAHEKANASLHRPFDCVAICRPPILHIC